MRAEDLFLYPISYILYEGKSQVDAVMQCFPARVWHEGASGTTSYVIQYDVFGAHADGGRAIGMNQPKEC